MKLDEKQEKRIEPNGVLSKAAVSLDSGAAMGNRNQENGTN